MLAYKNVDGVKKFNRSGVHQLTCPDCGKKCAGRSGRSFHKSCNELLQYSKSHKLNSVFAKHLCEKNEIFWVRQLCQDVKVFNHFRN
jgi:hypothetical protein